MTCFPDVSSLDLLDQSFAVHGTVSDRLLCQLDRVFPSMLQSTRFSVSSLHMSRRIQVEIKLDISSYVSKTRRSAVIL